MSISVFPVIIVNSLYFLWSQVRKPSPLLAKAHGGICVYGILHVDRRVRPTNPKGEIIAKDRILFSNTVRRGDFASLPSRFCTSDRGRMSTKV